MSRSRPRMNIQAVAPDRGAFTAVLTTVAGGAAKLGPEKGINLPDTPLDLPAMGPDDEFLRGVAAELRTRFGIGHCTIQIEHDGADCHLAPTDVI